MVSNVVASQRTDGSKKVDITYDVADPDTPTVFVSVRVTRGGATTTYPVSVTGDVGAGVAPGTNKHIVWDAGKDVPGTYGSDFSVCVTASDVDFIEMVSIPAGTFKMGNNGSEPYSYSNEFPQHDVYLSTYQIGKYEVTRGQYRKFIDAGGYSTQSYWSAAGWTWKGSRTEPSYWAEQQSWGSPPGTFWQSDLHPVVGVSYYEAEAFCNWAGGHLPTEAQWEKAARWTGTYPNVYPWGNTWYVNNCNNWDDTAYVGYQTAPVGSYGSGVGPYGLHDMAGNVWEWCLDWYSADYYKTPPAGGWVDPQGPASGSDRVLPGGSWYNHYYSFYFRCAYRGHIKPSDPNAGWYGVGFRIAR